MSKKDKNNARPQPGDTKVIEAMLAVLYEACRRAEENGWTVGQELGASRRSKLVEPMYALLLDERGRPVVKEGVDGQDRIATLLSKRLDTNISRVRVDQFCEGVDSADWGYPIEDDVKANESWFRAGWALGRAMGANKRPWWNGKRQRRVTTGWIVKLGAQYLVTPATIGTRKTGTPAVWSKDASRVMRFDDHEDAWRASRDHADARIVRLLRRTA